MSWISTILYLMLSLLNAFANDNVPNFTANLFSDYQCIGEDVASRSCMFTNICYSMAQRTWLFHRDAKSVTSLPFASFVDFNGTVSWNNVFPKKFRIALETSYIHKRSQFESEPGVYSFSPPIVINGPISHHSVVWQNDPIMLISRTHMDDNAGHVVFDQYFPIVTAISTHLGIQHTNSVTTVDMIWNKHSTSRYHGTYDKRWKIYIGNVLLKNQIHNRDFNNFQRDLLKQGSMACYRKVLVGCGQLSGLEGKLHHRQQGLEYIRNKLWEHYAPIIETSALATRTTTEAKKRNTNRKINVLMLQKNTTTWMHSNYISNWNDLVHAVNALSNVNVIHIVPYLTSFQDQVKAYRSADIVISLWGGISMLNFLLPPGGVQIIITSWYKDIMPFPNSSLSANTNTGSSGTTASRIENNRDTLQCPDFDDLARLNWGMDLKSLRFCTRDEGYVSNRINVHNFMEMVDMAVKYMTWKRKNIEEVP